MEKPENNLNPDPWNTSLETFDSGDSAMQKCLGLAKTAARTNLPILILGESGVGKTMLARAVHKSSQRSHAAFISFNAAALSDTLLESQLFGHEKGAFTGAQRDLKGKFELADKGTLFIDEIADMSLSAQAKILRAVEYGEYERLGSEKLLVSDVRVISATHLPIYKLIESDRFRRDLFYRLSGITLTIPPLRERPNDLRYLIASEIAQAAKWHDKRITGIDKQAAETLFNYSWPGNLRELKTVIHTAVALTHKHVITRDVLIFQNLLNASQSEQSSFLASSSSPITPKTSNPALSLAEVEKQHILSVIEYTHGHKSKAAQILGITRATLDRKLALFNV